MLLLSTPVLSDDTYWSMVVLALDVNKMWPLATRSCLPLTRPSSKAYPISPPTVTTLNTTDVHPRGRSRSLLSDKIPSNGLGNGSWKGPLEGISLHPVQ